MEGRKKKKREERLISSPFDIPDNPDSSCPRPT
jgi:hypothetical protein